MENTDDKNLESQDGDKLFFRTMADDLKSLNSNVSLKMAPPLSKAPKTSIFSKKTDNVSQKIPFEPVLPPKQYEPALTKPQEDKQREKDEQLRLEKEKAEQLKKEKDEAEKIRIENEKAEQFRIENEKIEQHKKEIEATRQELIKREQDILAQKEREKAAEMEKKNEEFRKEREKVERIKKEIEAAKEELARNEKEAFDEKDVEKAIEPVKAPKAAEMAKAEETVKAVETARAVRAVKIEKTEEPVKAPKAEEIVKKNEDLKNEDTKKESIDQYFARRDMDIKREIAEAKRISLINKNISAGKTVWRESPFVPENLPVDASSINRDKLKKEEKVAPAASGSILFRRPQDRQSLSGGAQNLSPESGPAKQPFIGISGNKTGSKENLAAFSMDRTSSAVSNQSAKFEGAPDHVLSMPGVKKKSIEEIVEEENSGSFFKKFIKVLIWVLIIAATAIGVYYFYITKYPVANPPPANISTGILINGATEAIINADLNSDLTGEIKKYFSTAKPSGLYRMILKDKAGQNSLGLENFSKSLGIVLPDTIANDLEKDYNLIAFNYPEKKYLRLGLALKVKNSSDISAAAKKWEASMYKDVKPIFFDNPGVYDSKKQFGSNKYNNFDLRYLPLVSANIALNYAIDSEKKFLLIAASKDDIFSLIDKTIKGN